MTVVQNKPESKVEFAEGRTRYIAHSDNVMMVVFEFEDGPASAPDKPHQHPHEQITYVAEGKVKYFIAEEEYDLEQGDLIVVPTNTLHCIQTMSAYVRLVDTFHPLREDFLE